MTYSAAVPSALHQQLCELLLKGYKQEDLCFGIYFESKGKERKSALIHTIILPEEGDRNLHGNVSFNSQYLERALQRAMEVKGGLVFMHSHFGPGWQGMSRQDIETEEKLAPSVKSSTGLPLLGMTIGTDGAWSGRFWIKSGPRQYDRHWCATVRVVGPKLTVTYDEVQKPIPIPNPYLVRTVSVWGEEAQSHMARLTVGVVGLGSVGAIVAESLVRMGLEDVRLIDFDIVKDHNLDRLLYATREDAASGIRKIEAAARELKKHATAANPAIREFPASVVEEEGYRRALDCDLLFCCVDREWPRAILNELAYIHLIPVIDGGIYARTKPNGKMLHAIWNVHTVGPELQCLECRGQFNMARVQLERNGFMDDPVYIKGLPQTDSIKHNENVFPFGLHCAAMELQQFVALTTFANGVLNIGAQRYNFMLGDLEKKEQKPCYSNCWYLQNKAKGDSAGASLIGEDPSIKKAG